MWEVLTVSKVHLGNNCKSAFPDNDHAAARQVQQMRRRLLVRLTDVFAGLEVGDDVVHDQSQAVVAVAPVDCNFS